MRNINDAARQFAHRFRHQAIGRFGHCMQLEGVVLTKIWFGPVPGSEANWTLTNDPFNGGDLRATSCYSQQATIRHHLTNHHRHRSRQRRRPNER